jgi:raffinose/stachyose/melibiose transport system substrate-binding protein
MKKLIRLCFVFAMMSVLVWGGIGIAAESKGKPVTLRWSFWWPEPSVKEFIEYYNKTNKDNIIIEYEKVTSDQYLNVMNIRLMSGEGPDLFAPYYVDNYRKMVKENKLVAFTGKPYLKNYDDEALRQNKAQDGKIYALPLDALYICMFYNKELLKKYKISPPKSWEEFLTACDKLKKNGVAPMIQGVKDLWQCRYVGADPLMGLTLQDTNFADKLCTGETKFTDQRVVGKYKLIRDFIKKGYLYEGSLGLTFIQAWQMFCEGQAAFMGGGTWYLSQAYPSAQPKFEVGTMPIPINNKNQRQVIPYSAISDVICVNKEGKHVSQALKFIEWFSQPDHLKLYSKMTHTMCAGKSKSLDFDANAKIFKEVTKFKNIPFKKEPASIATDYAKGIQDLVMGLKTPEEIANELQNKLEASLKK